MSYDILELKERLSRLKKQQVQNVEKREIFPDGLTHSFVPKIAIFPNFFLGNIGQENACYDILERKKDLLRNKNKNFKKSKNWDFSKGVNPWLWSKNFHFSNFFF